MSQAFQGDTTTQMLDLGEYRLEYQDIPGKSPTLLLLHEGLGSVGLWRGFTHGLAEATGLRTVAYSRLGHGFSDAPRSPRSTNFMEEEARDVVSQLLDRLDISNPIVVGHSDGASIALIYASEHPVRALALLAPHVFVEELSISSIRKIREAFEHGELEKRMARHHRNPESCFYGWNDVWLDPSFKSWNIEYLLPAIEAPTLLIQGSDDQYGTLAQIDAVQDGVSGPAERVVLECGHWPHLERPQQTLDAVANFVNNHTLG
jgi:pimeloyl-ACP methyl ester carboxylesterase